MPDLPAPTPAPAPHAAPAPLGYAPAPAKRRTRVLRHFRPGTPGFFLLIALLIAAGAWGGWKLMLDRDRKAFEACMTLRGVNTIEFIHPPSRGALRHLARLQCGPWSIELNWPAAEAPGASAGIAAVSVMTLWVGPGVDGDALMAELSRPGSGAKTLTIMILFDTNVTAAGLAVLVRPDTGLKALTSLSLASTNVTAAGLAALARPDSGLKALTGLDLHDTNVTDAGLAALARPDSGLKALIYLDLAGTHVTDAGVKALQQAKPSLLINH